MKTHDFYQPLTSAQLNENLEKQFGGRVNLVKYTREELEDMRNKLRTRIFQQEGSAGINELLTNETYQKDKTMMQLLNTRIKEMLGENIKALKDKMIELSEGKKSYKMPKKAKGSKPDFLDMDKDGDKKEPMKKAVADKKAGPKKGVNPFAKKDESIEEGFPTVDDAKKAAAGTANMKPGEKKKSSTGGEITKTATGLKHTAGKNYGGQDAPKTPDSDKKSKKVKEGAKPDFLDMDKDGDKKEPMKKAVADKKKVKESMFKHNVKFVNESLQYLINEDEEGKAKAITAASDIVNDFTSWMQRVGQYQTKAIIELADAIKADFGAAEAEAFKQSVAPALSSTLETLTQQREAISNAVAVLAGEAAPEEPMGMEPGMDMPPEPGMDMSAPDEMNAEPAGDEFAGADAAAGAGTTGREMRESKFARKLAESHSILSKLAK
jgi:hypothetical protein